MTINIPNVNSRAESLGHSENGVFIRSIRRAISMSKRHGVSEYEKFLAVIAQLDQAARRIEMSEAYKAGQRGEKHARIATALSLHEDVMACIKEVTTEHDTQK